MANEYIDKLKDEDGNFHPLHDSRISDTDITTWSSKQTALTAGLDLKIADSVVQVDAKLKSGTTRGSLAFAEGDNVEASGNSSHAEGGTTAATAECSHAEGCETKATNKQTHSEGYKTIASGECAHAEGNDTEASGKQSHAEGFDGVASGECSHAEGAKTKALGTSSHVEGGISVAYGKDSHAEGFSSTTREYKLKDGGSEMTASDWEPLDANTTQTDTSYNFAQHAEGYATIAGGIASHAEGQATKAYGRNSHAEGLSTEAFGEECHTEGISTQAGGKYCHAEGAGTYVTGEASHVEGLGGGRTTNNVTIPTTKATGIGCHSEGRGTLSTGNGCHAEGEVFEYKKSDDTYAIISNESAGYGCHAEGIGTYASSYGAHAEGTADDGTYGDLVGQKVCAGANGAHAEGIGTTASAPGAHAEGIDSVATAPAAHAEGKYTLAQSPNQHVVGKYNVSDSISKYAEIVGGGTSNTARKNIRTLDWNGNEVVTGSVTAPTVTANTSMTVGDTTFNSQNVIKWNKNTQQDTSDFDLAGFMLVTHTAADSNNVEYYPVNEDAQYFTGITNSELFTHAKSRCHRMNIQCAADMNINVGSFYDSSIVGKTFELVVSNTSTGAITLRISNNYGATSANYIRFINAVNTAGIPSGVYDGTLVFTIGKGTCREIKFTILKSFTNNSNEYMLVCMYNLLNYLTIGSSTQPIYFDKGIPTAITSKISLNSDDEQSFVATHTTSNYSIALGVGSGGYNRGIYDNTKNAWLVYKDSSNKLHLGTSTTGSASIPVYMSAGTPTACTSLNSSLIANVNQTPATPYQTTANSSESSSETTYNINFSTGSKWVGTRSTMSASGNGIVGAYLTDSSSVTNFNFLHTLHFNRTGNIGILYGYFVPRPSDYYFSKNGTTTRLSIAPKDCYAATFRSITCLTNSVGSCHAIYTGNYLINIMTGGDGVLRITANTNFSSFAVGASYFFTLPLAYTTFT